MLQSSDLPALHHEYHGTRNCSTIPWLCIQMVQPPYKDHQQPRSPLHFSLWKSHYKETRNRTKSIHCIPPSNWWTLQMEKSMDWTISPHHRCLTPRRLVLLDLHCVSSTQQPDQFNYQPIAQWNPSWLFPTSSAIRSDQNRQWGSGETSETNDGGMRSSHQIHQSKSWKGSTISICCWRPSMARRIPPQAPTPINQASP